MTKKFCFGLGLLSLIFAVGCAKGGNGTVPQTPTVTVAISSPTDLNQNAIYPTQSLTLQATTTDPANASVTWSITGTGCTGTPNPCGSFTSTTATTAIFQAPTTAGVQPTITATLASDNSVTGALALTIVDITTEVTPAAVAPGTLSIGAGLTQQFTAVAVPDAAPQTFTWTCTANGVTCTNFVQDPNVSGLARYTAQDNCTGSCIQISAASTVDPAGCSTAPKNCTIAKASLVASRVNGTYAFQFSGYDSSHNATALVGNFVAVNGAITSGLAEELTASGSAKHVIAGGSYTPTSADPHNSNNAGTLTLQTGTFPDQFQVALDGNGDIEMIESDGQGSGSGIAQKWSVPNPSSLFTGDQTYAFGFTGVDSGGGRVGFAGVLPMNGSGAIVGGQMDVNDAGTNYICTAGPCGVVGTYSADQNITGLWHMILTSGSVNMNFDFFISSGTTTKSSPLTFYAVSTGSFDNTHPEVSGVMVLQDSTQTYNTAAFKGTSVSALTGSALSGVNTNVSLTLGTTDGNGGFSGQFDQNSAGTILSSISFPSSGSTAYNYAASGTNGRYTFKMLGNPSASPVLAPLPFVLYASGPNRGFLLDLSSTSVIAGTMNPQGKGGGIFSGTELPSTFGAATTISGSSAVIPIAANLLLTSPGAGVFNVVGTQYPGVQVLSGTYTLSDSGTGTVVLTVPSTQNYVIYAVDTSGCVGSSPVCAIEDFFMMDVDKTNPNASIIFSRQ